MDEAAQTLQDRDEARAALLDLAIAAAGIGTFEWDLTTGRLTWDSRLDELFGYTAGTFDESIEAFNARLHPDDLPRVTGLRPVADAYAQARLPALTDDAIIVRA